MSDGRWPAKQGRVRVTGTAAVIVAIVGMSTATGLAAAQVPDVGGTVDKVTSPVKDAPSPPRLPSTPKPPSTPSVPKPPPVRVPSTPSLPKPPSVPTPSVGGTTVGSGSGAPTPAITVGTGSGAGTSAAGGSLQAPPGSIVMINGRAVTVPASGVVAVPAGGTYALPAGVNAPGFTPARGAFLLAGPPAPALSAASNLLVPFPIVVLEGTFTPRGVHVRRMRIIASKALVSVRCQRRCPRGMRAQRAVASRALSMRRFQRRYRAGAVLQIRVMARGKIGKYVRFAVRRAKPPSRLDLCTNGLASRPIRCPV